MAIWFKRKTYGWGWYPSTWQGWLVIAIYIAIIFALGLTIDENSTQKEVNLIFVLPVLIATTALVTISYKKGEKPRWQWGEKKEEGSDSDTKGSGKTNGISK